MKASKVIKIVYHSTYGHTERLARAVAEGARELDQVSVDLVKCDEASKDWESLHSADALIWGCPTYMGSVSAEFKKFMELTSPFWIERKWRNKVAAGFTNSASPSGDKLSTLQQLSIFAAQHGMIWIGQEALPSAERNRLGSFLGLMAQSPSHEGPDVAPPESDLLTARAFGKRVASLALALDRFE